MIHWAKVRGLETSGIAPGSRKLSWKRKSEIPTRMKRKGIKAKRLLKKGLSRHFEVLVQSTSEFRPDLDAAAFRVRATAGIQSQAGFA